MSRASWRMRRRTWVASAIVLLAAAAVVVVRRPGDAPGLVPRDAMLRTYGVRLYPPADPAAAPRAILVFLGNDVGFWRAHRQLASDLAGAGYAVAGIDIRPLLADLPADSAARDRAARARALPLIVGAYRALAPAAPRPARADRSIPLVLMGHSLGAEIALYAGAAAKGSMHWPDDVPRAAAVVALSPGSRTHLRISASDLLMTGEPTEAGSFTVAGTVATLAAAPSPARVAIVRGGHDKLASADPALLAAGGGAARRFTVPMAGHSLAKLTIARLVVRRAIAWALERP